jgi:hypothetical protein
MERPTCETCPCYVENQCRLNPPTVLYIGDARVDGRESALQPQFASLYPEPDADQGCSHHPEFNDWVESQQKDPEDSIHACRECGKETFLVPLDGNPNRARIACKNPSHLNGWVDI